MVENFREEAELVKFFSNLTEAFFFSGTETKQRYKGS
jgi:hypothetical protein